MKFLYYLKEYKLNLLMILICFLIQQLCSLSLPTFMSGIVDVGICRGGIEYVSPDMIPADMYRIFLVFMDKEDKILVDSAYNATKRDNIISNQTVYILKSSPNINREELDGCFLKSVSRIFKYINHINKSDVFRTNDDEILFDLSKLKELFNGVEDIDCDLLLKVDRDYSDELDLYWVASNISKEIYKELGVDVAAIQKNYILRVGKWMILITLFSLLFTVIDAYFSSKMSAGISARLRDDVFRKISSFSESEFNRISVSSLITRTTSDISQMKSAILMLINMAIPPMMFAGGVIMAIRKSISMSWMIFLGACVSSGLIITVFVLAFPKIELMQRLVDKFNLVVRERLSGFSVISSLGNIKPEERKFDKVNRNLSDVSASVNRLMMYVTPILTVVMNVIGILIIWFGAEQIGKYRIQVGDLMAFMEYSSLVITSFLIFIMMASSFPQAMISVDRVLEVLEMEPSIKDPEIPLHFGDGIIDEICFKNVSFGYDSTEVLKNINVTFERGQVVSIIGSTGSGKSTLVSLIPRLYDVSSGEILIDGVNIKNFEQSDLKSMISYIPQKSVLFTGDIKYNLKYGNKGATEERIKLCAEISRISDILQDDGFDRKISQEGRNLSGGQRQRICIARGLVKEAAVYIFDDVFSSLDFQTEKVIRDKIFEMKNNALIILVSQRICTVMNSDKIIVLDNGGIVGQGTHGELLEECKVYKEIARSQFLNEV